MHIVVLAKQVPATENVNLDPVTGTMMRGTKDNIINPLDENALTEAMRLKSLFPETEVTVLSMGPQTAQSVLRHAVALGAARAILLSGRSFAGADTIATSRALAAAINKLLPVDLVLAGERATDGETGQTGPMVAARLGIPVITYVRKIEIKEGMLILERIVEDGYEQIEAGIPALVTVVKDINKPTMPSLKQKLKAQKAEITVWGPEELGLDDAKMGLKGSPTRVVKVFSPKFTRNTIMFTGEKTEAAIAEVIRQLTLKSVLKVDFQ